MPLLCHCASNFCERFEFKLVIFTVKILYEGSRGNLALGGVRIRESPSGSTVAPSAALLSKSKYPQEILESASFLSFAHYRLSTGK